MKVDWLLSAKQSIQSIRQINVDSALSARLVGLIDLTSLNETDTEASVAAFCNKANTPIGPVAAVCVYPQFVRMVAATFKASRIRVATVVNFPEGNQPIEAVLADINQVIEDGANEVDVVFPYATYLAGDQTYAHRFVEYCKAAVGDNIKLKVILETGALHEAETIANAACDVISAGADFVKTSTGKIPEGATLEAAAAILLAIKSMSATHKKTVGLKVSGGIRELSEAAQYVALAETIMGPTWVTPDTFRIGASKLVEKLI